MRAAIDDFVSSVSKDSVALIYFSGFGLTAAGQTYLIPVDANVWSEADVQRDAVSLKDVVTQLNGKGGADRAGVVGAVDRPEHLFFPFFWIQRAAGAPWRYGFRQA